MLVFVFRKFGAFIFYFLANQMEGIASKFCIDVKFMKNVKEEMLTQSLNRILCCKWGIKSSIL